MIKPLRCFYNWALRIAKHKHAPWWLGGFAFIDGSVCPMPPDAMLVPMCMAHREKSFLYGTICALGETLGGIAGYAIGYFLFESAGKAIVNFYGMMDEFLKFQTEYNDWGAWVIFLAGFTPLPYKILTIASGVTHMNLPLFILAAFAGRGVRFYSVAWLLWKYGAPIQVFIEKHLGWVAAFLLTVVLIGFICVKYLL